jgi:hypothetical protein
MSVACARLTNAPDAGLPISSATSSVQKPTASADSAAEAANASPPKKISARRRGVSPARPISGSRALPKKPGIASTSPTST